MRDAEIETIKKQRARRKALTRCLSDKGSSPSSTWELLTKTTDASITQLPTLAHLWGTSAALEHWLRINVQTNARHNKVEEEESDTDR